MTKIIKRILIFSLLTVMFSVYSCDLVDPTEVKNPSITEENLLENANGGSASFVVGLHSQFASALTTTIYVVEPASDNYDNTSTFISPNLDNPRSITSDDASLGSTAYIYMQVQNLRALSDFGISTILPRDSKATDNQKAEMHYYRGYALLLLSENFWAFPIVDQGLAVTSAQAVLMAIDEFNTAYNLSTDNTVMVNCKYLLARAYRLAGNKTSAETEAQAALALGGPDYVYRQEYDLTYNPNILYYYLVSRIQNDLQPLPRLDFLDPKYIGQDSPTACIKAEESHLIIAEVAISNGNLEAAKVSLKNAIEIAKSRNTGLQSSDTTFIDDDPRRRRPNSASYLVKASSTATAITNLIQQRYGEEVIVYPVSNTSLTISDIDALSTKNQLVKALYLLRQEIFFLEGRRMSDLGIRLPVMRREEDSNPNFTDGSDGTYVKVPSYIPTADGMDAFTTDATNMIVTCTYDMNQLIADNYDLVKPF
jgi:hypothetical protein